MNLAEYSKFDAIGLARLVSRGEVTAEELAYLALAGVVAVNDDINAVIETYPQRASTEHLANLPEGPLTGVPFLNKDLSFPEKGSLFEMGSQIMAGNIAQYDAVAIERLRAAGLNYLGRTTTPEFGLVGVTESRLTGITRNPWDLTKTPSGSSGGSAAAISAGIVPVATASDGGGSIRGPAANCGLVGLKTTRGRVSLGPGRGESLCGLGVVFALTKTIRDTALLLDCLHGNAPGDPPGPTPPTRHYVQELGAPTGQLRIAYTESLWGHESVSEEMSICMKDVLRVLALDNHIVEEACPKLNFEPFLDATLKVWAANLAAGFVNTNDKKAPTPTAKNVQSSTLKMFHYGKNLSATDLLCALNEFDNVSNHVAGFFKGYDILVTPSSAEPAQSIGDFQCDPDGHIDIEDWNRQIYKHDSFYPLYNTTGQPAISLPLGHSKSNLPLGIQLAAASGSEDLLIRIASFLERAVPWADRRPPVHVANSKR